MKRVLYLLAVTSMATAAADELPPPVRQAMQSLRLAEDGLSVYVHGIDATEPLVAVNPDVPRSPASTIKVLTTYAVLDSLGPAYTWATRAYRTGTLREGRLDGDLVLEGGGDPFLVDERWWSFVRGVRRTGIVEILGDLVVDNDYFDVAGADAAEFDGQTNRTYNVLPDALLVNFQSTRFHVRADATRRTVKVAADPLPANLVIDNRLRLGGGRCGGFQRGVAFDVQQGGDRVVLSGTYPASCGEYALSRVVLSPPQFAYGTFRTLWEESGGRLQGGLRLANVPEDAELLYEMESLTLGEIVRMVNKFSNNVMSRHLLLTLAAERYGPPGTVENGRRALTDWLARQGMDFPELFVDNGSGLSRRTRISARHLAEILLRARAGVYAPEFLASLPLAATDGTLRGRLREPSARARLKTGRLDDVSSIAGYVQARSGATYVVVAVHNAKDVHRGLGEEVQDALVRWVYAQ